MRFARSLGGNRRMAPSNCVAKEMTPAPGMRPSIIRHAAGDRNRKAVT